MCTGAARLFTSVACVCELGRIVVWFAAWACRDGLDRTVIGEQMLVVS